MTDTFITNVQVLCPGQGVSAGGALIRDGRIAEIVEAPAAPRSAANVVDGHGCLLTPGLIDLHTHGVGTHLYERSVDDLHAAARLLPRFGTTCILPTLYRVMTRPSLNLLAAIANALDSVQGVSMPGLHLEGPFLALPGAGADTVPGDLGLLTEILHACRGRVLAMSISPETPNILPVIEHLRERRILPFITHTRATAEQTQAAIHAGAAHATHFYNVFPPPPETEPGCRACGAVEAVLADPRVSVDFICDGVHVPPVAIRAALAAKGYRGVILITDSNIGAGLPPGEYETTWGYRVSVAPGDAARIATPGHAHFGLLAGSALTMDQGIRNLSRWLTVPPHELFAMGTSNPARLLGLANKGQLRVGGDADLVLWDESLKPAQTWVAGECVYQAEGNET